MTSQTYQFDDFQLAPKQRKLFYRNAPVSLSSKAFEILLMLIEQRGKIVEKDEFLEKIWSGSFVEESNLVVHISALRRVLLEKKGERKFIETVSGRGYSFVAPVEEVKFSNVQSYKYAAPRTLKTQRPLDAESDPTVSIAVLPFVSGNRNDDLEYLAGGITQSLIDSLSQIQTLKVMAYSAVAGFKLQETDFQEIGFLLGVNHILSGHISAYKNHLDIRVELVSAKDQRQLWGFNYECELSDIFQVRKEISLAIAQNLRLKLTASDENKISRKQTTDSEAFKLYLKGKYILERLSTRRNREESLYQALDFFKQSLRHDANFALAYTGIGNVYNSLFNHDFLSRHEALGESRKALQFALRLDENLSEALLLKGRIELLFDREVLKAQKSFQQAINLNRNNPMAYHWQSLTFLCLGKFEEATAMENRAINYDPVSVLANYGLAKIFYCQGDFNKAIIQAEETLDIDHRHVASYFLLALSYSALGLHEEAIKTALNAYDIQPLKEIGLGVAYVQAIGGRREQALKILTETLADSGDQLIDFADIAAVYTALGDEEKVFFYLDKAYQRGSVNICALKVDSRFAALRGKPAFNLLLKKLKLA